ncbi:MAG: hypothetical protein H6937_13475 [Burkholderiales bacterium]|nr:hypothetical protein [Rhodospirillales bacterium]MCP5246898.1 hypothetical protein [Burkholderiales bacterium]
MSGFKGRGSDHDPYQINVITSDITYMKDTFCVAGWCPSTSQMKRLMINSNHWSDKDLKKIGKYASLNVNVIPKEGGRNYPHKTEDTCIDKNFRIVRHYDDPAVLAKDLRPSASRTIDTAFDGNIKKKSYVPFETKCSSLGAVILPAENVNFFKKEGKLRVNLLDQDASEYDLRVTCKYLRDLLDPMSAKEFEGFNAEMQSSRQKAHVRVGLAKPYVYKDSNCYLMCNGVFFYDE